MQAKRLTKSGLRQWLWQNASSPVNTGSKVCSRPLYAYAQYNGVLLPKTLPAWAKQFDQSCQKISVTIRGATAYSILEEIEKGNR